MKNHNSKNNEWFDLFISYSRSNLNEVQAIKEKIEKETGLRCWMDLSNIPCSQENFIEKVIPGINATRKAFLFFLTKESQESENAKRELAFAKNRARKDVIFIRYNDDALTDYFYFNYANQNIIDWRKPEQRNHLLAELNGDFVNPIVTTTKKENVVSESLPEKPRTSKFKFLAGGLFLFFFIVFSIGGVLWYRNHKKMRIWQESLTFTNQAEDELCGYKILELPGGAKMKMIEVFPGSFMMGSSSNEICSSVNMNPKRLISQELQHEVRLTNKYWLGETEVTQEQWRSVMGDSHQSSSEGDSLPVDQVSWEDCQEFIKKVNENLCGYKVRLPTEAEWEYACRADTKTAYSFGNTLDKTKANYAESEINYLVDVHSFQPNPWGFYNMHGNVSEWCHDFADPEYYGKVGKDIPVDNPCNSDDNRNCYSHVLRGGNVSSKAFFCRSASRYFWKSSLQNQNFIFCGFRLICYEESSHIK